jgi:hypothetical protein
MQARWDYKIYETLSQVIFTDMPDCLDILVKLGPQNI